MRHLPTHLKTDRLVLASLRAADAREVNRATRESYRELHPWMPWAKRRPTLAETGEFCRKAARDFSAGQKFPFLIRLRDSGQLLRSAGLVRGDKTVPKFEIGCWLYTKFTGQGYATEIVRSFIRFARRHFRVRRLEIRTDARNARNTAVAKRAGFKLAAVLHQDARDNRRRLRDTRIYAKLF